MRTTIRRIFPRDRLAVLAALAAPLLLTLVLVPFRTSLLTRLLALRSCRFEYGVAGLGRPARLRHDGQVTPGDPSRELEGDGLPADTELLVENNGILQGRFLMSPQPGSRPTLEQRLVAVAFADQVGAALAASRPVTR